MATLQELESALLNADAAGDVAAATLLANELVTRMNPSVEGEFSTMQPPEPSVDPDDQSFLREVADVPLKVGQGAVTGIRMISDAFGANNAFSQALSEGEEYIAGLLSAQSKEDSQEIARIMAEAEDKGVADQVIAGLKAFSVAPIDFVTNALGTAAPAVVGALLAPGVLGGGAALVGTGAIMGAGVTKGSIYESVSEGLAEDGKYSPEEIDKIADDAQEYIGDNTDMILSGTLLGALASRVGANPTITNAITKKLTGKVAVETSKKAGEQGILRRVGSGAAREGLPEFAQGAQEQLAANLAQQRVGMDTPTLRGVAGSGTLEGLAGAGLGGITSIKGEATPEEAAVKETSTEEVVVEETPTPNKFGIVPAEASSSIAERDNAISVLEANNISINDENIEQYVKQEREIRKTVVEGKESSFEEENGAVKEDLIDTEMDKLRKPFVPATPTPTAAATDTPTFSLEDMYNNIAQEEVDNTDTTPPTTPTPTTPTPTPTTTTTPTPALTEFYNRPQKVKDEAYQEYLDSNPKLPLSQDEFEINIAKAIEKREVGDLALPADQTGFDFNTPKEPSTTQTPITKKPVTSKPAPVFKEGFDFTDNRTAKQKADDAAAETRKQIKAGEVRQKALAQQQKEEQAAKTKKQAETIKAGKEADKLKNLLPGEKPLSISSEEVIEIQNQAKKNPAINRYVTSFKSVEEAIDNATFDVGKKVTYPTRASDEYKQKAFDALKINYLGKITDRSRKKASKELNKRRNELIKDFDSEDKAADILEKYPAITDKDIDAEINGSFYKYADFSNSKNEEKMRSDVSKAALEIQAKAEYGPGEGLAFGEANATKFLNQIQKNKNISAETKKRIADRQKNKEDMGTNQAPVVSSTVNKIKAAKKREEKAKAKKKKDIKDAKGKKNVFAIDPSERKEVARSRARLDEKQFGDADTDAKAAEKEAEKVSRDKRKVIDKKQKEFSDNLRQEAIDSLAGTQLLSDAAAPTENQINKEVRRLTNIKLFNISQAIKKAGDIDLSVNMQQEYDNLVMFADDVGIDVEIIRTAIENSLRTNKGNFAEYLASENIYEESLDPNLAMPVSATIDLNKKLSVETQQQIKNGVDTTTILETLINTPGAIIDETLAGLIKAIIPVVADVSIKIQSDLKANINGKEVEAAGLYRSVSRDVLLNSKSGMSVHILLHELYHAATSDVIRADKIPAVKQLKALFAEVEKELKGEYAATNVLEFVAEARSNSKIRDIMSKMHTKGSKVSFLGRFTHIMNNIFRVAIGKKTKPVGSALTELDAIVDAILSPSIDGDGDLNLAIPEGEISGKPRINKMGPWSKSVATIIEKVKDFTQLQVIMGLLDGAKLGGVAKEMGWGKIGELANKIIQNMRNEKTAALKKLGKSIVIVDKWTKKNVKAAVVMQKLIYSQDFGATIYNVDPTRPESDYTGKFLEGNSLVEVHKKQKKVLSELNSDEQAELLKIFELMRDTYREGYIDFRDSLFNKVDEQNLGKEATAKLKANIMQRLFPDTTIEDMVYFPLQREGEWVLVYDDKDLKIGKVVSRYTTKKERDMVAAEEKAAGSTILHAPTSKDTPINIEKTMGSDAVLKEIMDILEEGNIDPAIRDDVAATIIDHAPESAILNLYRTRKKTPGYDVDYLAAFRTVPANLSNAKVNIKYGRKLHDIDTEVTRRKAELDKDERYKGFISNDVIQRTLLDRNKFAMLGVANKGIESKVRIANQIAFVYTIGFNASSALIQLAQIPIFTYQYLGAEYGYKKAFTALLNGMKAMFNSRLYADSPLGKISLANGMDAYYTSDKEGNLTVREDITDEEAKKYAEKVLLGVQDSVKRGLIDNNIIYDSAGLYDVGGNKNRLTKLLDAVSAVSGMMFNQSERFNRGVTLLASYELELDRISEKNKGRPLSKKQEQTAIDESFVRAQFSNGGTALETGAPLLRSGVGRIAGMYKSYGLNMYSTMFASAYTFFDNFYGKSAEGKKLRNIAFKRLVGVHMSALLMTGVYGVPLYGAMRLILDTLYFEDDEDKTDDYVRAYFGEGKFKGPINNLTGLNVADRLRLTGLLITEDRFNQTDKSPEEAAIFYMGGPFVSTVKRGFRAAENFGKGDVERGIENMLPAGLSNVVKVLWRYNKEGGIRSTSGVPVYMDLTAGENFGQMFGFAPRDYALIQDQNRYKKRLEVAVTKERNEILSGLKLSIINGDFDAQKKFRAKQRDYNKRHPEYLLLEDSVTASVKGFGLSRLLQEYGVTINEKLVPSLRDKALDKFDPDS